jgi:hypothetical protein
MISVALAASNRTSELDLFDVDQELDLLSFFNANQEQRAERLFKIHQSELKKYYDITRRQSSWIFYVGVGCIALGFVVVVVALCLVAIQLPNAQLSDKLVVGGLGAVGSLLSNFIAAIYLRMYTSTVTSLTEFHSRLVGTHHLHYAFFLAAKISDPKLRERTIADMALSTSHGAMVHGFPPADGAPSKTDKLPKPAQAAGVSTGSTS